MLEPNITIEDGMGFSVYHAHSEQVLWVRAKKGKLVVQREKLIK